MPPPRVTALLVCGTPPALTKPRLYSQTAQVTLGTKNKCKQWWQRSAVSAAGRGAVLQTSSEELRGTSVMGCSWASPSPLAPVALLLPSSTPRLAWAACPPGAPTLPCSRNSCPQPLSPATTAVDLWHHPCCWCQVKHQRGPHRHVLQLHQSSWDSHRGQGSSSVGCSLRHPHSTSANAYTRHPHRFSLASPRCEAPYSGPPLFLQRDRWHFYLATGLTHT